MACDSCGGSCSQYLDAKCITVKTTYPCINVAKNDNLEEALAAINTVICEFDPPAQTLYAADGVDGEIVVTTSTIGDTTTFLVGLDPDITDLLVEITDDISTINTELDSKVCGITTNTPEYIDITTPSGCVYNIDFLPSGFPTIEDGIVYQQLTEQFTTAVVSTQILDNYQPDFTALGIASGDEIRINAVFGLPDVSAGVNEAWIRLLDTGNTNIIADLNKDAFGDRESTVEFDVNIIVNTSGNSIIHLRATQHFAALGSNSQGSGFTQIAAYGFRLPIDYSDLNIRCLVDNQTGTTDSALSSFTVEIRKKI